MIFENNYAIIIILTFKIFKNEEFTPPILLIYNTLRNKGVRFGVFVLLVFGFVLLFNGCEKESNIVFDDTFLQSRVDTMNYTTDQILQNVNFDQDGNIIVGIDTNRIVLPHASVEFQRELSMYIYNNADDNYIDSINSELGNPLWKMALLHESVGDENGYVVTVPMVKNNELSGLILYFKNLDENVEEARIISRSMLSNAIQNSVNEIEYYNLWLLPVKDFVIYEYLLTNNINTEYNNWVKTTNNLREDPQLSNRKYCFFVQITDWYSVGCIKDDNGDNVFCWVHPNGQSYVYSWEKCSGPDGTTGETGTVKTGDFDSGDGSHGPSTGATKTSDCNFFVFDFMSNAKIRNMTANNTLTDPCNPGKSTDQIISEAIMKKCMSEGADNLGTVDDLMKDLEKGKGKMNKTKSFTECKALSCLFDELYNNGVTNFCDLQNNFETDNKIIDVTIGTKKQFMTNNRRGFTGLNPETGRITIWFNPNICIENFEMGNEKDYDFLRSAKTIIHESIHADFWREIENLLPNGKHLTSIDQSTFNETFREFIDFTCSEEDGLSDQHEAIMNSWINKLSNDLWELNDKVGVPDDYLYLAWLGIYNEEENNECLNAIISKQNFIDLRDNYENHIQTNELTLLKQKELNDCLSQ